MGAQSKPPGKPPGRPRYEPGEGYYSISEAANILGISDAAIRQRIERGTLPSEQDILPNKERRRVIPRDAIDKLLPAQKQDTDEIAFKVKKVDASTSLLFEGLTALARAVDETNQGDGRRHEELREGQARILEKIERAMEVMLEAAQAEKEYQERVLDIMERQQRAWWRKLLGL